MNCGSNGLLSYTKGNIMKISSKAGYAALLACFILTTTGCASIKDENGKVVGTGFGAGYVLRAMVGANVVDSKTGQVKGNVPLGSVKFGDKEKEGAAAATDHATVSVPPDQVPTTEKSATQN
jgi:hypothetical protein